MHKRDPEGFRQPLALHAEGQDLRADGTAPAGVSLLPCRCQVHRQPDRFCGLRRVHKGEGREGRCDQRRACRSEEGEGKTDAGRVAD